MDLIRFKRLDLKFPFYYYLVGSIPFVLFLIVRYPVFSLSYDEAGQFWMALGQNHSSAIYSPDGGFLEVIKQNNSNNLDPGGFTYLLYLWLKISKSYLWIKLLPFIFFTGFVVYLVKLLELFLLNNRFKALLIIPVLFLSNTLPFYGVFLRAYSMEYFGIILTLYYLFRTQISKEFYFMAGIACAIFMWSRYGFCIHMVALYLVSVFKFKLYGNLKLFIHQSLYFFIPILASILLMYFITLKYQYVKPTFHPPYLKYMSNGNVQTALVQILAQIKALRNLPFFGFIILCLVIKKTKWVSTKLDSLNIKQINLIIYYFIFYHLINFLLSFLGLYPYSIYSYNTKQYEFFNILSVFFILLFLLDKFPRYEKVVYCIVLIAGSVFAAMKKSIGTNNVKYILTKYNTDSELFASINIYPTARYIIEQKLISSKYDTLAIYNLDSKKKAGSLIFVTQSEELFVESLDNDTNIEKLEGKKIDHSYIYRQK